MGTTPCEGGCSHTDHEHAAFDGGLAAGERGDPEEVPERFVDVMSREGWLTGYSVGVSNRRFAERKAGS